MKLEDTELPKAKVELTAQELYLAISATKHFAKVIKELSFAHAVRAKHYHDLADKFDEAYIHLHYSSQPQKVVT